MAWPCMLVVIVPLYVVDTYRELDLLFDGTGGVDSIYPIDVPNSGFSVGMWVIYIGTDSGTFFQMATSE